MVAPILHVPDSLAVNQTAQEGFAPQRHSCSAPDCLAQLLYLFHIDMLLNLTLHLLNCLPDLLQLFSSKTW